MRNFVVVLGMLLCLFGPTAIFTLVGYKSIEALGHRPSNSAKVMVSLVTKLVVTTVILMGLLMALLRLYSQSEFKLLEH